MTGNFNQFENNEQPTEVLQANNNFDGMKEWERRKSEEHSDMIDKFCEDTRSRRERMPISVRKNFLSKTCTFEVISNEQLSIDSIKSFLNSCAYRYFEAMRNGITNNCFAIARNEREYYTNLTVSLEFKPSEIGLISCDQDASAFVGWGNHCINFIQMPDNTFLIYDLTAGANIDENQGNFDVLIMHFLDFESLIQGVSILYGGKWKIFDPKK